MSKEEYTVLLQIYFRVKALGSNLHLHDVGSSIFENFMEEKGEILEKLKTLIDGMMYGKETRVS